MEKKNIEEKLNLPAIAELYGNAELALKTSQLQILLNQPPHPTWIKTHPIYENEYIPIEVIEWLLTAIFTRWWVEVLGVAQMLNAAVVTIRLNVIDPLTGETLFQDGLGAHNFQLDKDAKATEFEKLKASAVILAVPIAESRAISDAADKFGKIFGKDLNRKHGMNYDKIADKFDHSKALD